MKKLILFLLIFGLFLTATYFISDDVQQWTHEFMGNKQDQQLVYKWIDVKGIHHLSSSKPGVGVSYSTQIVIPENSIPSAAKE